MKVAIVSPGIGLVQRGFERLFDDLFHLLEDDIEVTLFKGGGTRSEHERVPWFLPRNGKWRRYLPIHKLIRRTPMHVECLTFALSILPSLVRERYDVVHCIDPPLAKVLFRLRNALGLSFRVLYTEGCAMPPQDYPPADHIQQISETTYNEARAYGYSADDMTLLPCGVFPDRFRVDSTREQLRERNGISPGTTVVLSVAALNRYHKRTDYLIREVAETEGDLLLWLDGSLDHGDPDLIAEAETKLGDRCRITHVPTDSVGELYAMADLMVHTATFEAFGLAIVEGAMMGLPLLIHNGAHFRWLVPNEASWVDMNQPGALAERLAGLMENRSNLASLTGEESARARFEWAGLKGKYASLYDRLMERDDDVRVPAIDS